MKGGAPGKPLSWTLSNKVDFWVCRNGKRKTTLTLDIKGFLCNIGSWTIQNCHMCFCYADDGMVDAK